MQRRLPALYRRFINSTEPCRDRGCWLRSRIAVHPDLCAEPASTNQGLIAGANHAPCRTIARSSADVDLAADRSPAKKAGADAER